MKRGPNDLVTDFCEALWRHQTAVIARLVHRIDPDGEDRWGRPALSMAAQYGAVDVVTVLLERGAAVDQGRTYLTPITYAARRGVPEILEVLRRAGATGSIATAIYLGDHRAVADALARDPTLVAITDEEGVPLLHHAAESLHAAIVGELLDRGAAIDATDQRGETALHRAADVRGAGAASSGIATLLLDRGAPVDAPTRDGVTPLHQAVRARNLAVVEVLLARGANPNTGDKRGSTPLHRAVTSTGASSTAGTAGDMPPLVQLLLARGGDPDAPDHRGRSPRQAARGEAVLAVLATAPRRKS